MSWKSLDSCVSHNVDIFRKNHQKILSGRFRANPPPKKNIELLVHHDVALIILKIVIENVILVDYQGKNVIIEKNNAKR